MTKAKKFRELLNSPNLEFICEAHNALSAKIVEEAGFKAIWGSGLTISASMGLRDNNEASWTQGLERVELMADAASIPLLLDADTGYGDFNNVRRLIKKLQQRDIAAVCIEDKVFPKKSSFIGGEKQPMASVEEFAGKIKAAKDAQTDADFCVIARTESFITGWGLGEAIRRADAYHKAGADAILIHSKIARPDEVLAFKKEWGDRSPVVIVPTTYFTTPTAVFRKAGFSAIIWANMLLRSAIQAVQETAGALCKDESLINIIDRIVPLHEIFRLQGADEQEMLEKLYLPGNIEKISAVILAASQGKELGILTQEKPKALLEVAGKPLLSRQVDTLNAIGIKDITVVRGFQKELINMPNLHYVDNDLHAKTQEVFSLFKGIQSIEGKTLVTYGDVIYKQYIPILLLETEGDFVIAADPDWKRNYSKGKYTDCISCNYAYSKHLFEQEIYLKSAGGRIREAEICGEWIGLMKLSGDGLKVIKNILTDFHEKGELLQMRMTDLFSELINRGCKVRVVYVHGNWLDVDDINDLIAAGGTT